MTWQFATVLITLMITSAIGAGLSYYAWQRRQAGFWAVAFSFMMATASWWTLFYLGELAATTLEAKLVWARLEYLAIVTIPVLWLVFALSYTGYTHHLTRPRLAALGLIPALTIFFLFTNDYHNLMWQASVLRMDSGWPMLDNTLGDWFWVHTAYSYLCLTFGAGLLLWASRRLPGLFRWQHIALLIGVTLPWLANIVYLGDMAQFSEIDISPLAFVFSGVIISWAIFRFQLLNLTPVASRLAVDTIPDGVMALDLHNRVVEANPAACKLFAIPAAKVIGQPIEVLLAQRPELLTRFANVHDARTELTVELLDGKMAHFDLQIAPIREKRARIIGRLFIFRDVTRSKQNEAALIEARDQAVAANQIKTEFLARLSHELRTPLSVIIGYAEALRNGVLGPLEPKQTAVMQKILSQAQLLTGQVSDLLDLSDIEVGQIRLLNTPYALYDVIHEAESYLIDQAQAKGLRYQVHIDANLPCSIYGDPLRVKQIIVNLVDNAVKFSDKGIIKLAAYRHEGHNLAISVSDEGPGIPEAARLDIFNPFHQLDGSMTRLHGGIGLGLTIVRHLVNLMEGIIQLDSRQDGGTRFTVILPLKEFGNGSFTQPTEGAFGLHR
jgi:PAS domain S-box-containing protein